MQELAPIIIDEEAQEELDGNEDRIDSTSNTGPLWKTFETLKDRWFHWRKPGILTPYQPHHCSTTEEIRRAEVGEMKTAQRWIVAALAFVSFVTVLVLLSNAVSIKHGKLSVTLDLEELTERSKCPACFGVNLCPPILQGNIELSDWTQYHLSKLVNMKNIFYASWKRKNVEKQLILKKLAYDHELDALDKEICQRHQGHSSECDVKGSVRTLINQYKHSSGRDPVNPSLHHERIGKTTDILHCPNHNKMEYIIDRVAKKSRGPHHTTILANILTMLLINPEPLILQAFPEEEGWPFPKYYGACGRIVAEEYVGERLTNFYGSEFLVRAKIAASLLRIAKRLSENDTGFILYLTDISPDNFAVSAEDYSVKVVDLENLVIVDNSTLEEGADTSLFESQPSECADSKFKSKDNTCFSFSMDDLCNKPVNDHNYYAVCSGLLSHSSLSPEVPEGFLHSIPAEVSSNPEFSKLEQYLSACNVPVGGMSRIEAADNLLEVLDAYIKRH